MTFIPSGAPYSRFSLLSPTRPSMMSYRQPPKLPVNQSINQPINLSIDQPISDNLQKPLSTNQNQSIDRLSPAPGSPSQSNKQLSSSPTQSSNRLSPSPSSPNQSTNRLSPVPSPLRAPSMPEFVTRFTNCRIIKGDELIEEDLWIQSGKIIDPAVRFWQAHQSNEYAADEIIDCKGKILAPGFIDIQINGAFGFDFTQPMQSVMVDDDPVDESIDQSINQSANQSVKPSIDQSITKPVGQPIVQPTDNSNDPPINQSINQPVNRLSISIEPQPDSATLEMTVKKGLKRVSLGLLQYGCTSYCPTLITSTNQQYSTLLHLYHPRAGSINDGATILGVHCEGPFLTRKGAHTESLLINQSINLTGLIDMYGEESINQSIISIITVAPEIPGMIDCLSYTKERFPSLVISMGHSSADFERAESALKNGASLLTHLFNAMIPFTHRDPGIVGLIGHHNEDLLAGLFYSLICDAIHTHPASVKLAYKTHQKGAIVVTDAMAAMGLDQSINQLTLGQTKVTIETINQTNKQSVNQSINHSRRAVVTGTQTLAGSIASIDQSVRTFQRSTNCSLVQAIHTVTLHPARCLKLQNKGRLMTGCDADLVLIDDSIHVFGVWIAGEKAWYKKGAVQVVKQTQQN